MKKQGLICAALLSCIMFGLSCKAVRAKKSAAASEIEQLKEGFLLVRLQTAKNKIEKLREVGKSAEARKVYREQKKENKKILSAFENYYTFGAVYFIYSDAVSAVSSDTLWKVVFNAEEQAVEKQKIQDAPFLIASFSVLQDGNAGIPALIVMDREFDQIAPPFPSAVRTSLFGQEDMETKAVEALDSDLHEYYLKSLTWKRKQELRNARKELRKKYD